MTAKEAYSKYIADDNLSELSTELITQITLCKPLLTLDFGMGSGKHANILKNMGIETIGIDVSMMNVVRAYSKYDLRYTMCADEGILKHLKNIDVAFTCSVLDHIEEIGMIVDDLKRLVNKSIIVAETNDQPGEFYYPHEYESYGFRKLCYSWRSPGDGALYHIWKWNKGFSESLNSRDDLG